MNEWNIQGRAHACEACAQPFADKQPYHTLLLDEVPELRRSDVCEPCWQKNFSAAASQQKGFISHWQGVYEAPPAAPVDSCAVRTDVQIKNSMATLGCPFGASQRTLCNCFNL